MLFVAASFPNLTTNSPAIARSFIDTITSLVVKGGGQAEPLLRRKGQPLPDG